MKTETRFNASDIHLNKEKENCKHPMLQPALNKTGFHTGLYKCIKCDTLIKDTLGIMMVKELVF